MRFSIIVPIYKVADYLDDCVQSVKNQTYADWELILVDDGSPDACPQMCDGYAKEDARIRVQAFVESIEIKKIQGGKK